VSHKILKWVEKNKFQLSWKVSWKSFKWVEFQNVKSLPGLHYTTDEIYIGGLIYLAICPYLDALEIYNFFIYFTNRPIQRIYDTIYDTEIIMLRAGVIPTKNCVKHVRTSPELHSVMVNPRYRCVYTITHCLHGLNACRVLIFKTLRCSLYVRSAMSPSNILHRMAQKSGPPSCFVITTSNSERFSEVFCGHTSAVNL